MEVELCWNCCVHWPNHCSAYCEVKLHQNHYGVIALRSSWVRKFQLQVICKSSHCECYGMRLTFVTFSFSILFFAESQAILGTSWKVVSRLWIRKRCSCLSQVSQVSQPSRLLVHNRDHKVCHWVRSVPKLQGVVMKKDLCFCASPFVQTFQTSGGMGTWAVDRLRLQTFNRKWAISKRSCFRHEKISHLIIWYFDHLISASFAKCLHKNCIWILWHIFTSNRCTDFSCRPRKLHLRARHWMTTPKRLWYCCDFLKSFSM